MEYRSSGRWYLSQLIPVLSLSLIALALHKNNNLPWVVLFLVTVCTVYMIVIGYFIIKQIKVPAMKTDDEGIHVRLPGQKSQDITWDSITRAHESSFCIKLTVADHEVPIQTNVLSAADKQSLLSEILSRCKGC